RPSGGPRPPARAGGARGAQGAGGGGHARPHVAADRGGPGGNPGAHPCGSWRPRAGASGASPSCSSPASASAGCSAAARGPGACQRRGRPGLSGRSANFQTLCRETLEGNKGRFDFRLVSKADVFQHISKEALPADWDSLKPRYQKDTAINAILAQHGGVAIDIHTIMFRGLDDWWEDSIIAKIPAAVFLARHEGISISEECAVATPRAASVGVREPPRGGRGAWGRSARTSRATEGVQFKGFYYTSRAETATWFMMVGTGRMMREAVERQKKKSGNEPAGCTDKEKENELCYGSGMVSWALCKRLPEYCKCYFDEIERCELTTFQDDVTDYDDELYELADPRKSVQSPLQPDEVRPRKERWQPMFSTERSPAEFGSFLERFEAGGMPFITLQAPGEGADKSREELLADTTTFFYQWLCLAGHPDTDQSACGREDNGDDTEDV
ncbi:unnamed protein product, partial [Prorocentrum cordatum]